MSSSGRLNGNVGSNQSKRPMRERKQTERFGHFEASADLEELIEASQPQTIAPAVRKGGATGKPSLRVALPLPGSTLSIATGKPSLWVTLPLPRSTSSQVPTLSSLPSNSVPTIKIEDTSIAQAGPSSQNPRKRTAAPIDADEDALFAPSSSREPAPKRQRARKPTGAPKAKAVVKVEEDRRPEPRGQPEVWAEGRQALCESLPYYLAMESAAYSWGTKAGEGGCTFGFLLDYDHCAGSYMDENVVIARTGGGVKRDKTGKMEEMGNSKEDKTLIENMKQGYPVMLIVGAKNKNCPTRLAHRYNVLGAFHVTDYWPVKVVATTTTTSLVYRIRFDKIDLKAPSWWGPKGSTLPTQKPDYVTKAEIHTCSACGESSKQRYAPGWICLNQKCAKFSSIDGNVLVEHPAYNPAFINERKKWPRRIIPTFDLKPDPQIALRNHPQMTTSHAAWKGMVCPDCGRCNSRVEWDQFRCGTEGCPFEIPIQHTARPQSTVVPEHGFEADGHAICFDKWEEPIIRTKVEFHGYWRKSTYELFPGCFISHYSANKVINRQPGGADEIFEELQTAKLGMKRSVMEHSPVEGDMLTRHFGKNFGLPYKFVASPESKGFSEAPQAIMEALKRVTWAGQDAIQDGSYRSFNELLCLGYMEDQKISFHDDGEKDLGPDIVSYSLGGAANMQFRIKAKYWSMIGLTADNYDPTAWVLPGSQAWKMRLAVNEHYKAGRTAEYDASKSELIAYLDRTNRTKDGKAKTGDKAKKAHGPVTLTLELRHGDMVVMHGERIQEIYEHGVKPKGMLRYGLTGRYIKPENIPVSEHWKGAFTIAPDKVYDGDLALFRANFPEDDDDDED